MAETDVHRRVMMYLIDALGLHFADQSEVYVAGNNFVYYEEGNSGARISPDAYVVFGAGQRERTSYYVWAEGGQAPDVVFEITSKSTRGEDTGRKHNIYERVLRVPEYFMFDPTGDYLRPRLQGYRLAGDRYEPVTMEGERLHSAVLGLDLVPEGTALRLYDPELGGYLPTLLEEHRARALAETRAEQERQRAAHEHDARTLAESRAERLAARLRELGVTEDAP